MADLLRVDGADRQGRSEDPRAREESGALRTEPISARLRLREFHSFAQSQLQPVPARVLEVGCGRGEVALALAADGYDVTAIDPEAPDGAIFRRARLEDFDDADGFDAAVASVSFHHVASLDAAFAKVASLLRPGGLLILEEFAKERIVDRTARWYFHQRQSLVALNDEPDLGDFEGWLARWHERHAEVHPLADLRTALDAHFDERHAEWGPYLYDHWLDDDVEPLERKLVVAGAIEPVGFRYVGAVRA